MSDTRTGVERSAGVIFALMGAVALTACLGEAVSHDAGTAQGAWTVGEPILIIAQGPGTDFFDVAGAARLSDGRVVVADGGSSEVRYFAPDGSHQASVGGRGEGPGEFALIQSLGPAGGDSVWVYDYGATRITILAPDGAAARTATVTPPLSAAAMVGRRSDGSFVMAQMWGSGAGPIPAGLVREKAAVVAFDALGRFLDTLALVPGREVLQHMEGGRMVMGAAPLGRTASHALLGDDVVVGDQVDYGLELLGADGTPLRELRWTGPSLKTGDGDVARWMEERLEGVPEADRSAVRVRLAEMPFPDRRPAYDRILTDTQGCVWVAAYPRTHQGAPRWDLLSAQGRWSGSVLLPSRFTPRQVGPDWILGVARDALDVERLEVRSLHRPSPSGC